MTESQVKLIKILRSFIGAPYKYGAKPEEAPKCFDCSLLTKYALGLLGYELERSTILQAAKNGISPSLNDELKAGDLLFFRGSKGHYDDSLFPGRQIYIGHVAVYSGNGKAIHAAGGKGVIEETLTEITSEKNRIIIVKRVLKDAE